MMTTIFLVRHATPDWSRTDLRYDIPPGPPLTPAGEAEATQLGAFLQSAGVTQLYASPLERTMRTAALAADIAGASWRVVPEIAEWRNGETEQDVLSRIRPIVDTAFEAGPAAPLAIITHGGPVRLLLQDLGLDQAEMDFYRRQFDSENPLPPAGAWRITREPNGQMKKPELVFAPQSFTRYVPTIVHL